MPVLKLLVRPSLGLINENDVIETFLHSVSRGADANRVMGMAWKSAGLLRVERRDPLSTRAGKILHMHVKSAEKSLTRRNSERKRWQNCSPYS